MPTGFMMFVFGVTAAVVVVFAGVELTRRLPRATFGVSAGVALAIFAFSWWMQPSWLANDAILLALAVLAGGLVGKVLPSEGALVTFVVVGAVSDAISVFGGLTSILVQRYMAGTSLLLQYLSLSVPYGGKVFPIVGIGDLFFAGAVMFALAGLGHPKAARLLVPLGGLILALTVALLTRFIAALPALALVTIGYLVVRRRTLVHARSEAIGPPGSSS